MGQQILLDRRNEWILWARIDAAPTGLFPGYPLAARLAAAAFGVAHPTVGQLAIFLWAVAGAASAVAAVMLWRLVEADYGSRTAGAAVALLVFGPYSLFLEASYSESLFLALAITAWWVVSRGSWLLGGLLAGAASFTRINGVFLVLALVVLLVVHRRKLGRPYLGRAAGLAAIGLSGLSAYFAYLFVATGNIHAWSDAEAIGWHRSLNWPWATLANTVNESLHAQNPNLRVESALDLAFAVLALVAVGVLVRGKNWPEAVFIAASIGSMMTSYTYLSLARNTLILFPLTILLARTRAVPRWRWVYWTFLSAGVLILVGNVHEFTLGRWVG